MADLDSTAARYDAAMQPREVTAALALLAAPTGDVDEILRIAKGVRNVERFDLAVAVLELIDLAPSHHRYAQWLQQSALCLSKDHDVPVVERHERALALLARLDLENTDSAETLGIAGGICKRWWLADGQRSHLDDSLRHYARGHTRGNDRDGYAGINTAYLLDLLTSLDPEPELPSLREERERRFASAAQIRREVIAKLADWPDKQWWYYATLAEAHLGLGELPEAVADLRIGIVSPPSLGELKTTMQQLADLARIRPPAMRPLSAEEIANSIAEAAGLQPHAFRSAVTGKVGLALSGGGFRASLFHIGVLAALADAGLLRHIEVLSCVSGGSIIGAHYYLELRRMLMRGEGSDDAHYVQLVDRMRADFLAGIATNIRVQLAKSFAANVRMTIDADYSRTERAGELYEEVLYSRTGEATPIYMHELMVAPTEDWAGKTPGAQFQVKYHNWQLRSKVPILILNATTLNTGHTWQFTASYMGEPPLATSGTDAIERLRRFYYGEAPEAYQRFRLGRAVAASACVPGLFEPVVLRDLYPGRTIRLVDGGIHDNQGVGTLLDEGCRVILISDASGQMQAARAPDGGLLAVPLRSDDVLQARLRETQLDDLLGRKRAQALQGLLFVHLTKDLDQKLITWIGGREKPAPVSSDVTSYDIRKDVQQKLAEVRTDLDAFSECEAFALMTSGYQMTRQSLTHENLPTLVGKSPAPMTATPWPFLAIAPALGKEHADTPAVLALLCDSNKRFFRVWTQDPQLRAVRPLVKSTGAVALLLACVALWRSRVRVGPLLLIGGGLMFLLRKFTARKGVQETIIGTLLTIVGYPIAKLHASFNDRFLGAGKWPLPSRKRPGVDAVINGPANEP
jgi:predicted acylesterase/phospholipase RssA